MSGVRASLPSARLRAPSSQSRYAVRVRDKPAARIASSQTEHCRCPHDVVQVSRFHFAASPRIFLSIVRSATARRSREISASSSSICLTKSSISKPSTCHPASKTRIRKPYLQHRASTCPFGGRRNSVSPPRSRRS